VTACAVVTGDEQTESAGEELGRGSSAEIARGEYLVEHLLLCGNCHNSQADGGAPLSGGKAFAVSLADGGSGSVYAANLTPDKKTGLGHWTVDQIARALLRGLDNEGKALHPTMPYSIYGNLERSDAVAIAQYLKSLPPTSNVVPERTVTVDAPAPRLEAEKLPEPMRSSEYGHAAERGKYLAALGAERGRYLAALACVDCHTQRAGAAPDLTVAFAGGRPFGPKVKSSNLTPDATGLAGWTAQQIVDTLTTGHQKGAQGAALCPPMPSGSATFGGLTRQDLGSLAAYFLAVPRVPNGPFEAKGVCK
jgi:mono/diheme cytochrome c family protein